MQGVIRALGFLALSIVIGELVKRVLTSRVGESAMTRLGHPEMATLEGANAVSKEAKRAVGLVKAVTSPKPSEPEVREIRPMSPGWVSFARDASEMLLAAGALLRAASDFVNEDEKLKDRVSRIATRKR